MGQYAYDDVVAFKDALGHRKADIRKAFIKHLFTYALGREVAVTDQKTIDEIEDSTRRGGLQDVIVAIAKSDAFTRVAK